MKKKLALLGLLGIIVILVGGCVSKATYESLQNENTQLTQELVAQETENRNLEQQLTEQETENRNLEQQLTEAENHNIQNSEEINRLNNLLAQTTEELNTIKDKYPLRDFPSYSELEQFAEANIQPITSTADKWYGSALKLQEIAMQNGYLVSAGISDAGNDTYFIFNLAIAGSALYWWDPEDGILYQCPFPVYK
jgi:predicted nuclease with TOPRIM domain